MILLVKRSLVPAPKEPVIIDLTRLAAHFWSERGKSEWGIVFEDYADDLAEFPADIIGAGIRQYRQTSKWWPKDCELLEIVRPMLAERRLQLARLEKLLAAKAEDTDREADRATFKSILGEAHDDFMAIPWQRRYTDTPEAFVKGWTSAEDKAAFCAAWGAQEQGGEAA